MNFHKIDLKTWPPAQMFYYYSKMAVTTFSVNISIDVTNTRKFLKEKNLKFFPAYVYIISKNISKENNLCITEKDNDVGFWDFLNPVYPQFHEDDKTTSLLWTEYSENFEEFYENYTEDIKNHGNSHGVLSSKGIPPENSFVISCIPWFTFNSFSLYNHGIKNYYFPSFESGAFYEENKKILMPLSVTVHHANTDGYLLKTLFENIKKDFSEPYSWIK